MIPRAAEVLTQRCPAPLADLEVTAPTATAFTLDAADLRIAGAIVRRQAEAGAILGGWTAAHVGALFGLIFAVSRGLIPDLGTTLAVGMLGVLLLALAGGFLGALAGGVGGASAGILEVASRWYVRRARFELRARETL